MSDIKTRDLVEGIISGEISRTIILLSDRKITKKEENHISSLGFSTNRFKPKRHKNQTIKDVGGADFFIIELDCPIFGRSKGMTFYEHSYKYIEDSEKYVVVFVSTEGRIRKDNACRLGVMFTINKLPKNTDDGDNYLRILLSEKMPHVRSKGKQIWQFATSAENKKK